MSMPKKNVNKPQSKYNKDLTKELVSASNKQKQDNNGFHTKNYTNFSSEINSATETFPIIDSQHRSPSIAVNPTINLLPKPVLIIKNNQSPNQPQDLLIGKVLGNQYKIESCLGNGGGGTVYKAINTVTKEFVAIKLLKNLDRDSLKRFTEREAKADIIHPNVIKIIGDIRMDNDNKPYLVMEYINGDTLAERLDKKQKLSLQETKIILSQLCEGVSAIHKKNIIHRDLKPSNLIITTDNNGQEIIKIIDFGLVKPIDISSEEETTISIKGIPMGTPEYMSPEQCQAEENLDDKTDVYSIGIILFRILTGKVPFKASTPFATCLQQISEEPPLLREKCPEIPEEIEKVVMKALSKDRNKRQQSVKEVEKEFSNAIDKSLSIMTKIKKFNNNMLSILRNTLQLLSAYINFLIKLAIVILIITLTVILYKNPANIKIFLNDTEQAIKELISKINPKPATTPIPSTTPFIEAKTDKTSPSLIPTNTPIPPGQSRSQTDRELYQQYSREGKMFYKSGSYENAINAYVQAIEKANKLPKDKDTYFILAELHQNLGLSYKEDKQHELALKMFKESIDDYKNCEGECAAQPNIADNYYYCGNIYYSTKEYKLAISDFEETIRINNSLNRMSDTQNISYVMLGQCYYEDQQYEKAIGHFKDIINNGNLKTFTNSQAHYYLGRCYVDTAQAGIDTKVRYSNAIKEFKLAIGGQSKYVEAYYQLGYSYKRLNDLQIDANNKQLAIDSLVTCLDLIKTDPEKESLSEYQEYIKASCSLLKTLDSTNTHREQCNNEQN